MLIFKFFPVIGAEAGDMFFADPLGGDGLSSRELLQGTCAVGGGR